MSRDPIAAANTGTPHLVLPDRATSIADLVGHTPLLDVTALVPGLAPGVHLHAKLEGFNPGGSVKDRAALWMVRNGLATGALRHGKTIIDSTSGNTGIALAMIGAALGYPVTLVMPDNVSRERKVTISAFGAHVVFSSGMEGSDGAILHCRRLLAADPERYFKPDQYNNPMNPQAHYESTGPEIWEATEGRVTHFVAGIGTGGTISGTGRYLKEVSAGQVQVVGADPAGSVYSGGDGRPYLVEGVGEDFWPTTYDPTLVDRVVKVSDAESFAAARRVTREEGLLIGGSGGTAVHAALVVGRDLGPDAIVVVLLPDSGRGYLSKVFNDEWMTRFGFLQSDGPCAGHVMDAKRAAAAGDDDPIPDLVIVTPNESARRAVELMHEHGVSQVIVAVTSELPLASKEVSGTLSELQLMDKAFRDPGVLDRPVVEVMEPPMPMVGIGETVTAVVEALDRGPSVLVLDGGHPVGVLTRQDVLAFLAARAGAAR